MAKIIRWLGGAMCLLVLVSGTAKPDVIAGQLDQFDGGTTQGWGSGAPNPNPPAIVSDGGPAGAGDAFLKVESRGGGGAGSKLAAFNSDQWSGDFLAAGVNAVALDLKNLGLNPLDLRLRLQGPGGDFFSSQSVPLAAQSDWQHAVFGLDAANLTGGSDLAATLSNVSRLWIFSSPNSGFPPPAVVAELGVDNIRAVPVPEPATIVILATFCLAALVRFWCQRNRSPNS